MREVLIDYIMVVVKLNLCMFCEEKNECVGLYLVYLVR